MRYRYYNDARHADGSVASSHTLTVYTDSAGTDPATLYAAQTGVTTTANPTSIPVTGIVDFWANETSLWYIAQGDTVVRPLRRFSSDGVNVRDYGAVGDGVTDDADAIQAALDAASSLGGGAVRFPSGTYLCGAIITVPSSVTLRGDGPASVIDFVDDGTATGISFLIDTVTNVRVKSLAFVSSNTASRTGVYGHIRVQDSSHVSVTDCDFGLSSSVAVFVSNSSDVEIARNRVDGPLADGIHVGRGSKHVRIVSNYITNCGDDAIGLISVRNDGAVTYDPNEDILVEGNQIYDITPATNVGCGVNIAGGHNIKVVNNTIDTVNYNGVVCWGGPTYFYTYKVLIQGNYIRNVGVSSGGSALEGAIRLANTRDVQLLDNDIDLVPGAGYDLAGAVREFVIRSGPMRRVTGCGVLIVSTHDDTAAFLAELWTDIGDTAPAAAITGDGHISGLVAGTGDTGIYIGGEDGYQVDGITIDADIRDAGDDGIEVIWLTNSTIRARTRRSADCGIYVGNSTECDVSATCVDDDYGVFLINTSHTVLHDCRVNPVQAAAGSGIYEDSNSSYNTIVNNVVHGPALVTDGSNGVTTSANRAY